MRMQKIYYKYITNIVQKYYRARCPAAAENQCQPKKKIYTVLLETQPSPPPELWHGHTPADSGHG